MEGSWDLAVALARQWFRDQCIDAGFSPFFVFYRPSAAEAPGDVVVAKAAPGPEYRLASLQAMSTSWDILRACAQLHAIIEPLPILPTVAPPKPRSRGGHC
jgi:hypothetical protein